MRVGITFFLREKDSIWGNGAAQNVVFLWLLLRAAGHEVVAINAGEDVRAPSPGLMLSGLGITFVRPEAAVLDQLDVLIEAHGQLEAEACARVHAKGGKTVAFRFGNSMLLETERIIHNKPSGAIQNGAVFDAVWTNPQHTHSCASYWETLYRAPVVVVPHLWEPLFVDAAVREFPKGLHFDYQPGAPKKKKISIFEPNINLVKTAVIPLLVCEHVWRTRPELIEQVFVTNALHIKPHVTFTHFVSALDVVRARHADGGSITSFEGRFNTPWFLAKHTDVVVAHQFENGLNYAYYDALYGGYPLVHNSELLPKEIGYRYSAFDAKDGGAALTRALLEHDGQFVAYRQAANAFLDTTRATHKPNIEAHERALMAL